MYVYIHDNTFIFFMYMFVLVYTCTCIYRVHLYVNFVFQMANSAQYCLPLNTSSRAAFTSSLSPTSTAREHHISSPRATGSHSHHERVKRSMVVGPRLTPNMPGSPCQAVPNKKRISSSGSYGAVDICSLPAIQLARQVYTTCMY